MPVSSQQIVKNFSSSWFAAVTGTGVLPLPRIFGLGLLASGLLAMFWIATLVRSVRGAIDGSLFQPH